MNPRLLRLLAGLAFALRTATGAAAGDAPDAGFGSRPVAISTRLVAVFSALENELGEARERGDNAALERLLAVDFEQRSAAAPGQPLPRDAWMARKSTGDVAETHDMAVHDHGTVAVVSFASRPGGRGPASFVVDVWKKEADAWQLSTRYVSALPGAAARPAATRPTGKE